MFGLEEHLDHEMGCMSEQQNAYALSSMELDRNPDCDKINEALGLGLFVVVVSVLAYCHFTDAALGEVKHFAKACPSREAAENYIKNIYNLAAQDDFCIEENYEILPKE